MHIRKDRSWSYLNAGNILPRETDFAAFGVVEVDYWGIQAIGLMCLADYLANLTLPTSSLLFQWPDKHSVALLAKGRPGKVWQVRKRALKVLGKAKEGS